jgi:hypothetical protein
VAAARAGDAAERVSVTPPGGALEFCCAELGLKPGAYYIGATARERATGHVIDWWDGGTMLYVEPGVVTAGHFHMPHTWRVEHAPEPHAAEPTHTVSGR